MSRCLGLLMAVLLLASAQAARLELDGDLLWRAEDGRVLDRVALRAKRWDQRPLPGGGAEALLLDAERGQLRWLRAAGERLIELGRFVPPDFEIERVCLHRDAQGLLHALLLGKEGLSAQWLLHEGRARPLRHLATGLEPAACVARDAEARLYVAEPGVGLWSHGLHPERAERRLLQAAPGSDEKAARALLVDWLQRHPEQLPLRLPEVQAVAQTTPVARLGDAADDPAIWRHPTRPERSRVLGTDKQRGLAVYDLQGRQRQFLPVGRLNNVDLRQGLRYGGRRWDLGVATQRDANALWLFEVRADGRVHELALLPTGLDDIYGVCVGRNAAQGLDVFVNDKDGRLQRLRIEREGGRWTTRRLAELRLGSQPEGCVVDESGQQLFVGEERVGVWRLALDGGELAAPELVIPVGGALVPDVEGLAIFGGNALHAQRYLIVSSQGNDSYVLHELAPPFRVRGAFRIGLNAALGIDGVSETDGLELSSADFGGAFRHGLLVVQDGHKRLPDGPQNFKLLPFEAVLRALALLP